MDEIDKTLQKLSSKERGRIKQTISRIKQNDLAGLNIKKLKGQKDIFRVRKGNVRIMYRWLENKLIILAVERRSEKTYKDFQ